MPAPRIPEEVSAQVLFEHDRTCCVCNQPGLAIQIHHIDENPSNNDPANLAVLCLQHHEETQVRGGFGKKLKAVDVQLYRREWLARVVRRREEADKIVIARLSEARSTDLDERTWARPSMEALATTIQTLPLIYEDIYKRAAPYLQSIVRHDMLHGLSMVIDVFAESWLRLATWLPPSHFGNMAARDYISAFIADCNHKNMSLHEPDGPGSGGREAAIYALGDTMSDVENLIDSLVRKLGSLVDEFSYEEWRAKWDSVSKQRYTVNDAAESSA
jgi:hypothetical protein